MNDRNHDHFREATKKVDYIDRNEAIEAIKNDALDLVYYGKKEAIECLESVPAADGRPVVYGEWIDKDGQPVGWDKHNPGCPARRCWCSNCGDELDASDEYPIEGLFCPHCGADMRGKKVQDDTDEKQFPKECEDCTHCEVCGMVYADKGEPCAFKEKANE